MKFGKVIGALAALVTCAALSAAVSAASYNHVFIVMFENTNYSSVIGNSSASYFNSLVQSYGWPTQYYGNTHPSIGNYFELTTGQILTNDDGWTPTNNPVSADNVVRRLLGGGKTWKTYAENLPSVGYLGGDVGNYLVHHNPLAYLTDAQAAAQRNNIVPFEDSSVGFAHDLYAGTLPNYSFIVPNACNSAHSCSLSTADTWLQANIKPLIDSMTNSLVIIAFDESANDNTHGGGRIYAALVGRQNGVLMTQPHQSTTLYQHQSVLRESLEALGLAYDVGDAATAPSMAEFFPAMGPLAWYPLDTGTINGSVVSDKSGNVLNGTLIGSPTSVPGVIGQGLQFDGSSTAISVNTSVLNFKGQSNAFSLSTWINTSTHPSAAMCIICKAHDGTGQYQLFIRPSGVLGAIVGDVDSEGTTNVLDGQKHLVTVTVPAAGTGLQLYVDAHLETFSVGNGSVGTTSNSVDTLIGARRTNSLGLLRVFNGMIDEPRIYPRVITQAEIQALYDAGTPSNTTGMLLGLYGGNECGDDPACTRFHQWAGRYPDFTENCSYMGPGGGDPSHCDLGYPFVAGFSTVDNVSSPDGTRCGGYNDMAAAARGDYDGAYQSVINNGLLGGPGRPYAIRINWEWDGWWFCHSPWPYESCCNWNESNPKWTPAIWTGAVRRLVGLIRATPGLENVKIQCDAPPNSTEAMYYPGDDVCDLSGSDTYFNQNNGSTADESWNNALQMLNYKSAFAAAHGKPFFIGEWCDAYDGINITRLKTWMLANNVVGHVYWDTDYSISDVNGCALKRLDSRKAAYLAAFGGTTYSGTYWSPLLPLPADNPMDY